jgi:hypothetical protein
MRWLLTTVADVDRDELRGAVEGAGGKLLDDPPIPLDRGEVVVEADGPEDLRDRLDSDTSLIHDAYPSSRLEMY